MTDTKTPPACERCAFARKSERELHVWHCHRFPPTAALAPAPGGAQLVMVQPMVHPANFCGEFAAPAPVIH